MFALDDSNFTQPEMCKSTDRGSELKSVQGLLCLTEASIFHTRHLGCMYLLSVMLQKDAEEDRFSSTGEDYVRITAVFGPNYVFAVRFSAVYADCSEERHH